MRFEYLIQVEIHSYTAAAAATIIKTPKQHFFPFDCAMIYIYLYQQNFPWLNFLFVSSKFVCGICSSNEKCHIFLLHATVSANRFFYCRQSNRLHIYHHVAFKGETKKQTRKKTHTLQ